MAFHFTGYSNFHDLNLDYILAEMGVIKAKMAIIDEWYDDYNEQLKHLETIYAELVNKYNDLEASFDQFVEEVNTNFDNLETELTNTIQAEINAFNLEVQLFENQVNYRLDGMQTQITVMDRRLDEAIEHLADNLQIINPFTGELEPISSVIDTLAGFHMEDAITAGEYDALAITAQYYDGLQLTAYQYDVQAKQYLN